MEIKAISFIFIMKMKNMLGCNEVYGDVESGKQE